MTDVLLALRFALPYPAGRGIAVVGLGGGPSVQASDQMERLGLKFPALSPDLQLELCKFLPVAGAHPFQPLDATNILDPEIICRTLKDFG